MLTPQLLVFLKEEGRALKKIKLVIGYVVIMLGFIMIGESHHFYLENFTNHMSSTTLYLQNGIDEETMKTDVLRSANKNGVGIFVIDSTVESTFKKTINIYINDVKYIDYMETELGIYENIYKSIFSGIVNVDYRKYEEAPNIAENHTYFLIGDPTNIKSFKLDLIDQYAGNHPTNETENKESERLILLIWLLIYMLLLILTIYEILLQKKEVFVKVVYGERISIVIIGNILIDTFAFSGFMLLSYFLLKQFTAVDFYLQMTIKIFIVFVIVNALLYLRLLFANIRLAISPNGFLPKTLFPTYIMKGVSIVISIIVISSNMIVIINAVHYYNQREFFEEYSDYYYTNLGYRPITAGGNIDARLDETSLLRENFYQKYFDTFKPILLVYLGEIQGHDVIMTNLYAKEYLFQKIPSIEKDISEFKYYYIFPEDISNQSAACDAINIQLENYEEKDIYSDYEILKYAGKKKILYIDESVSNGSDFSMNPIIILNNTKPSYDTKPLKSYPFKNNYEHDIMFKIDHALFQQFKKDNGLENQFYAITNILEKYEYNWLILKRLLYINLVFSILLLMLEIIIIKTIISLEFKINAMQLSLKKILGYSFFERYGRMVKISITGCAFSTIAGTLLSFLVGTGYWPYVIFCGLCLWCFEFLMIRFEIYKMESLSISNILKGESI